MQKVSNQFVIKAYLNCIIIELLFIISHIILKIIGVIDTILFLGKIEEVNLAHSGNIRIS